MCFVMCLMENVLVRYGFNFVVWVVILVGWFSVVFMVDVSWLMFFGLVSWLV